MASIVVVLGSMMYQALISYAISSILMYAFYDPPSIYGPRQSNLKVQTSAYSKIIPISYGINRLAGNIIWAADIQEHSNTSGGGKGSSGPEVTTYSYTCSFAVGLCEGTITSISKVWADGLLIYDPTNLELASLPITIYTGTDTQQVDPTIESIIGINNSPAYRGQAYIVFTDWDITKYGSRIPNLTFEVVTSSIKLSDILIKLLGDNAYIIDTILYDIDVKGYSILQKTSIVDILKQLMLIYQFDVIESDSQIKFIKRGSTPELTINSNEVVYIENG